MGCVSIRCVRTTLDIADDILIAARELARHERKTVGQVISERARRGLQGPGPQQSAVDRPDEFLGFRPLPQRGVVVASELINRLREEEVD